MISSLGDNGAFIDDSWAEDNAAGVGSPVKITFPNGTSKTFRVEDLRPADRRVAVRARDDLGSGLGRRGAAAAQYLLVPEDGGWADRRGPSRSGHCARRLPEREAQTRQDFIGSQISGLSSILNILYVLALSIIVSLFGIVNTLVLTVFERTREIGISARSG